MLDFAQLVLQLGFLSSLFCQQLVVGVQALFKIRVSSLNLDEVGLEQAVPVGVRVVGLGGA